MNILITTSTFGKFDKSPLTELKKKGFNVLLNPHGRTLSLEEALKIYNQEIVGVIAGTEPITKEVMGKSGTLRVISRCGLGIDNIDLVYAKKKKIAVFKTTEPVAISVAELTMGLILNCLRYISKADRIIREGNWKKPMGSLLRGKTLGIVGLGNIGKFVVQLCSPFGIRFLVYDQKKDLHFASKYKIRYTNLDALMEKSDIISIHLPFCPKTKLLINSRKLKLMKKDAILINTSRGNIVDEDVLFDLLKENKIAGAALDVFSKEPYKGKLTQLDNIVLTSHIGSYAKETRVAMEMEAVEALIKGLTKKEKRKIFFKGGKR